MAGCGRETSLSWTYSIRACEGPCIVVTGLAPVMIAHPFLPVAFASRVVQSPCTSCPFSCGLTYKTYPFEKKGASREENSDIVGDTGHSWGHPGDIIGQIILTPGRYSA